MVRLTPARVLVVFLLGCALVVVEYREALLETFAYQSSPIDWCEDNFVHSKHIVEFWNTLSSLSMIFVALFAPGFVGHRLQRYEPNSWMLWSIMVMVGIGSILFHATLSVAGQILDELPICLLGTFSLFMLKPLKKWNRAWRKVLFDWPFFVGCTVGSTIACLLCPILSHVFTLSFIPLVSYNFLLEYGEASRSTRRQAWPLFLCTIFWFVLAFGCWLVDKFFCKELQVALNGFNPQLHAWWHVFISLTFWGTVATGIVFRCCGDGVKVSIRPSGYPFPYMDCSMKEV